MYVLVVYDVAVERVGKVHKFLKGFLHWRQNSVFEGELTESQIEKLRDGLDKIISADADSVLFYISRDARWLRREHLGKTATTVENFL